MFLLKKKEKSKDNQNINTEDQLNFPTLLLDNVKETEINTIKTYEKSEVEDNTSKKNSKTDDFSAFYELARLLNTTIEKVKDECCMFQVKNLMKKLAKVIVRFNVSDSELEKILINCATLTTDEVLVSPAYLPACRRLVVKNQLERLKVSAVIDFPFGESTFKSKVADVKDGVKLGVDGVSIMMPVMLTLKEKQRELKKQIRAFGRFYKHDAGVAFSVMDMSDEQIKTAIRVVEKSKLGFITFVFGESTEAEVKQKMQTIKRLKGKKEIKILGNVSSVEAVMELFKMGVDKILTPFADDIGYELIKRFKIKSLKLL